MNNSKQELFAMLDRIDAKENKCPRERHIIIPWQRLKKVD
jgi:hypothetical protein